MGRFVSFPKVQSFAARVASGARKFDHVIPTLKQLYWLPVAQHGEFYYLVP